MTWRAHYGAAVPAPNPRSASCHHPTTAASPAASSDRREFEMRKVVDQLRSAGVIEAIRIARASYADRLPHAPFARRFGVLVAAE